METWGGFGSKNQIRINKKIKKESKYVAAEEIKGKSYVKK